MCLALLLQKAHWKAGHKQSCKPPTADSEATRAEQLLQTAVLKPEQIIQRNAPVPAVPRNLPPGLAQVARVMPHDDYAIFVYNKHVSRTDRICPKCRIKYRWVMHSLESAANGLHRGATS